MASITNNNNNADNESINKDNENISDDKIVTLVSQQGDKFDVPIKVALHSKLCETMINDEDEDEDEDENGNTTQEIPLVNVKSEILALVITFCKEHSKIKMNPIEKPLKSKDMKELVSEFDYNFIQVEQEVLFELILAANYMDIKDLLDLTCATVASMIKGKSPEEIRKTFDIVNDFTPEQEAQIREENKWAEED